MKNVWFKLALGFVSVAAALAAVERYNKRKTAIMESAVEAATAPYKDNPPTEDELAAAGVVDLGTVIKQATKDISEKIGKPVKTVVVIVDDGEEGEGVKESKVDSE